VTIKWTEELQTDICDHLSTGKSIIDIAKLQGYPSADSIYRQMYRDEEFATRIARARKAGQDYEADNCIKMADDATEENYNVVKLRIWARQWRAAKLNPKYGDKQQIEHTGHIASDTPDDELDRRLLAHGIDPATLKGGK
jgi:hypothetical protein